eukprot:GEMP01036615.1.p3 GENE.GEMP01036615.1~~GEMP01036615.1.p3  ORF type:complete len:104 (+),score=22.77 GEMP01036615.1:263-574(+)
MTCLCMQARFVMAPLSGKAMKLRMKKLGTSARINHVLKTCEALAVDQVGVTETAATAVVAVQADVTAATARVAVVAAVEDSHTFPKLFEQKEENEIDDIIIAS